MRENLVFIDANVFLACYRRRYSSHRKLLASLRNLGEIFLVTGSVRDEFNRNRLQAYLNQSAPADPRITDNLELRTHNTSADTDLTSFRKINEEMKTKAKEARKLSEKIHKINIDAISHATDDVSVAIKFLFDAALEASEEQHKKARYRREVGNPPGKPADPLGDQLSWEQILDEVGDARNLWIITEDTDYGHNLDTKSVRFVLNPFLFDEIKIRNSQCNVECFRDLAAFLEEIKLSGDAARALESLAKEIVDAKKERRDRLADPVRGQNGVCPKSEDGKHLYSGGRTAHPSIYGGWSYWTHCEKCGARFDTGEPYDD